MTTDAINSSYSSNIDQILGAGYKEKTEKEKDPLGRDAFLTMLVAQLQHQDPLNPMEGADFSAQLAQFSSLEQLFNVNDNLTALKESFSSDDEDNVLDYIGKSIKSSDSTLMLKNGQSSYGRFTLEEPAEVFVSIKDADGVEIQTLYAGKRAKGSHEVKWNGLDKYGDEMPDGTYTYEIMAIGENGRRLATNTTFSGKVEGVTYKNGFPYLQVDGRLVNPASVQEVFLED